jgi:hypothetical protein
MVTLRISKSLDTSVRIEVNDRLLERYTSYLKSEINSEGKTDGGINRMQSQSEFYHIIKERVWNREIPRQHYVKHILN